jgi:hypothetical protein
MAFEDGVDWEPAEPQKRGRHKTFASALDAVVSDILTERNDFFDSLSDRWPSLFPGLAAKPGRYDGGKMFLYVKSAPALFATRPKLPAVKRALAKLPGAPKSINLVLEIHR